MTYKIMVESAEGQIFCALDNVQELDLEEEFDYVQSQYEDAHDVWTESSK